MRGRSLLLIVVVGGFAAAYCAGAWYFAGVIVRFQPYTLEEDRVRREYKSVADRGLPEPETIRIAATDAGGPPTENAGYSPIDIEAWYFANPAPADCAVIIQHGHKGTRWAALRFAPLFWKRGCDLILPDARYHGKSGGDCGGYGYHERYDMQRVIAWLQREKRPGLRKNQIGLVGVSMGGAIVLMTAELEPEIGFVVADSSFASFEAILRENGTKNYGAMIVALMLPPAIALADLRCNIDVGAVAPVASAAKLRPPLFVAHSVSDMVTGPHHSRAIYDAVSHDRRVLHVNDWGAAHGRDVLVNFEGYDRQVSEFLAKYAPDFGR